MSNSEIFLLPETKSSPALYRPHTDQRLIVSSKHLITWLTVETPTHTTHHTPHNHPAIINPEFLISADGRQSDRTEGPVLSLNFRQIQTKTVTSLVPGWSSLSLSLCGVMGRCVVVWCVPALYWSLHNWPHPTIEETQVGGVMRLLPIVELLVGTRSSSSDSHH